MILFLTIFIAIDMDLFTGAFQLGSFEVLAIFDSLIFVGCVYRYIYVASDLNLIMRDHIAILRAHQFQISRALLRFREYHYSLLAQVFLWAGGVLFMCE